MIEELQAAGMNEKEARLYLATLARGPCSVQEAANHAGVERSNAYGVLKKMEREGLVTRHVSGAILHYAAISGPELLALLQRKSGRIESILPELERTRQADVTPVSAEVFTGKQAITGMLDRFYASTEGPVRTYGNYAALAAAFHYESAHARKTRIKRGMHNTSIVDKAYEVGALSKQHTTVRINPILAGTPLFVVLDDARVAQIDLSSSETGILIESEALAKHHALLFEMLLAGSHAP